MKSKRGLLLLSLPVAGAALLVAALAMRGTPSRTTMPGTKEVAKTSASSAPRPTLANPPKPAAPDVVTAAANDARLRGAYQNYRTAVATNNTPVRDALAKVLRRDPEAVERIAREELANSKTPRDREIALRTLEALRN